MTAKELVSQFAKLLDGNFVDWAFQMNIAKSLVARYTEQELLVALDMYKGKMYSLGFLNEKNMAKAKQKTKDTIQINYEVGGDIAERNKRKAEQINSIARVGKRSYFDMLQE